MRRWRPHHVAVRGDGDEGEAPTYGQALPAMLRSAVFMVVSTYRFSGRVTLTPAEGQLLFFVVLLPSLAWMGTSG